MKKLLTYISLVALAAGMTACQDPEPEIPRVISILIKDTGDDFITAYISPPESAGSFRYALGTSTDVKAFSEGTLPDIVTKEGNMPLTHTFTKYKGSGLKSNFTYYIMATTYDKSGKLMGGVRREAAKTTAEESQLTIALVHVTETEVKVTITPGYHTVQYKYAIGKSIDAKDFYEGKLPGIKTVNGDKNNPTLIPTTTETFEGLTPGTPYAILAMEKYVSGEKGPVHLHPFTTEMTKGTMTVEQRSVGNTSATVSMTRGQNIARFYYSLRTGSSIEQFEKDVLDAIQQGDDLPAGLHVGDESTVRTFDELTPATDYTLYVMPVYVNETRGETSTLSITTS